MLIWKYVLLRVSKSWNNEKKVKIQRSIFLWKRKHFRVGIPMKHIVKGSNWNLEPTTRGNKRFSFLKKAGKLLAIDTACVKYTVKTVGLNSKTSHVKMYDSLLDQVLLKKLKYAQNKSESRKKVYLRE